MHHNICNSCLLSVCLEMDIHLNIHLNKHSPTQGLMPKHWNCQADHETAEERTGRQSTGVASGALLWETPEFLSRLRLPRSSGVLQCRTTPSSYDPFPCIFKEKKIQHGQEKNVLPCPTPWNCFFLSWQFPLGCTLQSGWISRESSMSYRVITKLHAFWNK